VNITYHKDGNVGIGTPQVKWDASAPLVMSEPVERMRVSMTDGVGITPDKDGVAFIYTNQPTEWARIDKDGNVTHLDMDLCAKGPHNAYTALALAIWNRAIEEAVKYAVGEGNDTMREGEMNINRKKTGCLAPPLQTSASHRLLGVSWVAKHVW
jgi:hypothetical protein